MRQKLGTCSKLPPNSGWCSRDADHEGPCAVWPPWPSWYKRHDRPNWYVLALEIVIVINALAILIHHGWLP